MKESSLEIVAISVDGEERDGFLKLHNLSNLYSAFGFPILSTLHLHNLLIDDCIKTSLYRGFIQNVNIEIQNCQFQSKSLKIAA